MYGKISVANQMLPHHTERPEQVVMSECTILLLWLMYDPTSQCSWTAHQSCLIAFLPLNCLPLQHKVERITSTHFPYLLPFPPIFNSCYLVSDVDWLNDDSGACVGPSSKFLGGQYIVQKRHYSMFHSSWKPKTANCWMNVYIYRWIKSFIHVSQVSSMSVDGNSFVTHSTEDEMENPGAHPALLGYCWAHVVSEWDLGANRITWPQFGCCSISGPKSQSLCGFAMNWFVAMNRNLVVGYHFFNSSQSHHTDRLRAILYSRHGYRPLAVVLESWFSVSKSW